MAEVLRVPVVGRHAGDVNDAGDSQSDEFRRIGAATVPKLQPASERPAGEWNDVEIVCDGNSLPYSSTAYSRTS